MEKYYDFRRWFNRNFKLSLNGKFRGVFSLLDYMDFRHFEHFVSKFLKLTKVGRGRYCLPVDDKFIMRFHGLVLKFYFA